MLASPRPPGQLFSIFGQRSTRQGVKNRSLLDPPRCNERGGTHENNDRRCVSAHPNDDKPQARLAVGSRIVWSRRSGLNGRPAVYETAALPTELRRLSHKSPQLTRVFSEAQGVFRLRQTGNKTLRPRRSGWLKTAGANGHHLNRATGCSLTEAPWPGAGRQRGSCSWATLSTCHLV